LKGRRTIGDLPDSPFSEMNLEESFELGGIDFPLDDDEVRHLTASTTSGSRSAP
jgi:hypothetical protein